MDDKDMIEASSNHKHRILVVEDEAMVAMVMRWSLERLGYAVCDTVATGEEAIDAAAAHEPDLILMDVHLPGNLSGIDAAREITARQDVPFIFFTGYSEEEVTEQVNAIQSAACLSKPVDTGRLATVITETLDRHKESKA